jgi:hypothetical protein
MHAALAGLLGTAIGAFAGVIGSLLTARQQDRAERTRLQAARLDELVQAERQALLHLTELLAAGTHEIAWLAWAATNRTDDDEFRKEIASYDQRMREFLPQIAAAAVGAAGLSRDAFDRIDPLVQELTHLDFEVGTEAAKFDDTPPVARHNVSEFGEQAASFRRRTVAEVRAMLLASVEPDDQPPP